MTSLTVRSVTMNGNALVGMYCAIWPPNNAAVKTGYTPFTYNGSSGLYSAEVSDFGQYIFDHWANGPSPGNRRRTQNLISNEAPIWVAYFRSGTTIPPPPPPAPPKLTIKTVYPTGTPAQFFVTVYSSGNTLMMSGNTPVTGLVFTGIYGATYVVGPQDYGNYTFDHWENGVTARQRSLTLTADTTIIATYKSKTGPPPPPPPPVDTTPPTVNITSPASGAAPIVGTSITVSGTSADASGVNYVEASLGTAPMTAAQNTTSWSKTFPGLAPGNYTVNVRARDNANNWSQPVTRSFTMQAAVIPPPPPPSDTTLPNISITSPTNSQTFIPSTTSVQVIGIASDNVGVTLVERQINGGAFTPVSGSTSNWSFTASGLAAGQAYTVAVRARDAAGNTKTATVAFSIQSPIIIPPPPPPTGGFHPDAREVYVAAYFWGNIQQFNTIAAIAKQYPKMPVSVAMNVASGPGDAPNQDISDRIAALKTAQNIHILGYLASGYQYAWNNKALNTIGGYNLSFSFSGGQGYVKVVDTGNGSEIARIQQHIDNGTADTRANVPDVQGVQVGISGVKGIVNILDEVDKWRAFYPDVEGLVVDEVYNWPWTDQSRISPYGTLVSYAKTPRASKVINGTTYNNLKAMKYFKANLGGSPVWVNGQSWHTTNTGWTDLDISEGNGLPEVSYLLKGASRPTAFNNNEFWRKSSTTRKNISSSMLTQPNMDSYLQHVKQFWAHTAGVYDGATLLPVIAQYVDAFNRSSPRNYY